MSAIFLLTVYTVMTIQYTITKINIYYLVHVNFSDSLQQSTPT